MHTHQLASSVKHGTANHCAINQSKSRVIFSASAVAAEAALEHLPPLALVRHWRPAAKAPLFPRRRSHTSSYIQ